MSIFMKCMSVVDSCETEEQCLLGFEYLKLAHDGGYVDWGSTCILWGRLVSRMKDTKPRQEIPTIPSPPTVEYVGGVGRPRRSLTGIKPPEPPKTKYRYERNG